jgi:hypothetical protein
MPPLQLSLPAAFLLYASCRLTHYTTQRAIRQHFIGNPIIANNDDILRRIQKRVVGQATLANGMVEF